MSSEPSWTMEAVCQRRMSAVPTADVAERLEEATFLLRIRSGTREGDSHGSSPPRKVIGRPSDAER
jgi:hypothetical protein